MSEPLQVTETILIGSNKYYFFAVGKLGERWIGFAGVGDPVKPQGLFLLPEVARDYQVGVEDRDLAIRITGAVAQENELGYGGITTWDIAEELRGKPDDFRCAHCGALGCWEECRQSEGDYDYE